MKFTRFPQTKLSFAIIAAIAPMIHANESTVALDEIVVTAEQQIKQSLGVSRLPTEEIKKQSITNDVSEIVRKMPGVNLTGNTATGQRGNNRQIDIRGMGPENTLILIDGRPVKSKNSVRYSWRGQRDTRGDSNWIPVEQIESIEVLRGPAAARYGSGAAGGVVNIKTKSAVNDFGGSLNVFTHLPQDNQEGQTKRIGLNFHGNLIEDILSFRLYGNFNQTDADALDINQNNVNSTAAGREGVKNKDIAGRLIWNIANNQKLTTDMNYSRQGNIYAGDSQYNRRTETISNLHGAETNRIYRQNYAMSHEGQWEWGTTKITGSYEYTKNSRYNEGLAGSAEGTISDTLIMTDSVLKNYRLAAESSFAIDAKIPQMWTFGMDLNRDTLVDPSSMSQSIDYNFSNYTRSALTSLKQDNFSAFIENNMLFANDQISLVPAIRIDHNSHSGRQLSPSLNAFWYLNDHLTIKGGIAQAYKSPNLYQSSPGYVLFTRGNGCPIKATPISQCYLVGNANLKPETSLNKEIGLKYNRDNIGFTIAYFHNDYQNKIAAGSKILATGNINRRDTNLIQWENIPNAVVSGIEGSLKLPIINDKLTLTNNFTYMIESKDKSTNNPLSIVPKYTINSFLDWQITSKWDAQLNTTFFGPQKPRKFAENNLENRTGLDSTEVAAYTLVEINTGYQLSQSVDFRMGIKNLFDKKIYRSGNGANTYNEAGRSYYANLKFSF